MTYYLIGLFICILLSFYLAVRSEYKFQRKIHQLVEFRKEIENISQRFDTLNTSRATAHVTNRIIFTPDYLSMDFNSIVSGHHSGFVHSSDDIFLKNYPSTRREKNNKQKESKRLVTRTTYNCHSSHICPV